MVYCNEQKPRMLKLNSNPRNIACIEDFVQNVCRQYRIKSELYGNILISLTEAVNNAIIHGNNNDEKKTVQIELDKCPDCISFRVSDQGRGFNYRDLPDPTCPENLTKCGGRGVFLMRELSDGMEYRNNGRTVEMRFKL